MEKQKLPNEKTAMLLGIFSFIGCCCSNGILGLILAGIGYHLASKDELLAKTEPETYALGSISTWKTVNLISLIISVLTLAWLVYTIATGKYAAMQEDYMKLLQQLQNK